MRKLTIDKQSLLLYAVTDRSWLKEQTLAMQVEECLKGGVTFVQLREKNIDNEAFLAEAREVKKITDLYHIPFVINDNVEVALACGADGVHIGQKDQPVAEVRKKMGPHKIVGVSAQTVEQARQAEADGADYLGVGAVFPTSTKKDADTLSFQQLQAICQAVSIPVVAIGGINENNVEQLKDSGIDGIAVVSAIFSKADIQQASKQLHQQAKWVVCP